MKILILDGYIDEPGCLGVPPYLAPLPRYIYGAIKSIDLEIEIEYQTIDQFRKDLHDETNDFEFFYEIVIIITGVYVPGKYLGGVPIQFSELRKLSTHPIFNNSFKIVCGPATQYGVGEEGGKQSIPIEQIEANFQLVIKGDAEIAIHKLLKSFKESNNHLNLDLEMINEINSIQREQMDDISKFSILGSEIIKYHPNFSLGEGGGNHSGNLICEIETFRGCPRYKNGGCSFCIEPTKGKTKHRDRRLAVDSMRSISDLIWGR